MRWRPFVLSLQLTCSFTVRLVAQCPDGSAPPCGTAPARARAPQTRVAVVHFENLSADTADAYLAEGLAVELTARLGQIHRLQIMSRDAVRRARVAETDPMAIGQVLGVKYLVGGSVRRSGGTLRVTVELINAATGVRMWGEQYDRAPTDLLLIEEDIARRVSVAVAGRLLPGERAALARARTSNRIAYDHYLRGLVHFSRRVQDPAAVTRSLREFEAAVAADSTFAQAYARMAMVYAQFLGNPALAGNVSRDTALSRAAAATERALSLDSSIADAWLARGRLLAQRDSQPSAALGAYRRALTLDPNNAEAFNYYGFSILANFGAVDESRTALTHAVSLEPNHPTYLHNLAIATFAARRFDDARRWWDSALAVAPNAGALNAGRTMAFLALGDTGRALQDARRAESLLPTWPWPRAVIALIALMHGDSGQARAAADQLAAEAAAPDADRGFAVAAVYTALGDQHRALDYLEAVRPQQGHALPLILSYVFLDPLRSSPRFMRLVEGSVAR